MVWVTHRLVFYSNSVVPRIYRIFESAGSEIVPLFEKVEKEKRVEAAMKNKHIARRADTLLELISED